MLCFNRLHASALAVALLLMLAGCGGSESSTSTNTDNTDIAVDDGANITDDVDDDTPITDDDDSQNQDDDNDGPTIGGDTIGYTGRLAWTMIFGSPELRVWDMQESNFVLYKTGYGDTSQNVSHAAFSANQGRITYTLYDLLGPSTVAVHDLETNAVVTVPLKDGLERTRAAAQSALNGDGQTVVFIETIYAEPELPFAPPPVASRGLATWTVGDAQPLSISDDLGEMDCPRISANGMRVVVRATAGIYLIDHGAEPALVDLNDNSIKGLGDAFDSSLRCALHLSDDGNRLTFSATRDDLGHDKPVLHIHDLDSKTTTPVAVSSIGEVRSFSTSADGQRMAFDTWEMLEADIVYRLYAVDLSQPDQPALLSQYSLADATTLASTALSRDGQTIAFVKMADTLAIEVMRFDGTDRRTIRDDDKMYPSMVLTF